MADGTILEKKLGFNKDCNSVDQMFVSHCIFEKNWKNAKQIHVCILELEKTYNWIPRGSLRD